MEQQILMEQPRAESDHQISVLPHPKVLYFNQGIAEATSLLCVLKLYAKRGIQIRIKCAEDIRDLFQAAGIECDNSDDDAIPIVVPPRTECEPVNAEHYWTYNRVATMIACKPLPPIDAPPEQLWPELKEMQVTFTGQMHEDVAKEVEAYVFGLPRPLILINPVTNMASATTSIPRDVTIDLFKHLLDNMAGTILVADWEGAVPRLGSYRVRHLSDKWRVAESLRSIVLAQVADVVLSVDSTFLCLASLTNTAIVAVCLSAQSYPAFILLPRTQTVHIVPHDVCSRLNRKVRIEYNIVEIPRGSITQSAATIAGACLTCSDKPRYLQEELIGADVQLQQFVLDWERGYENPLSGYVDRHRGYDILFKELIARFADPHVVETSTISREETWRIDGYSTYLIGSLLQRFGGRLTSVDSNLSHQTFASQVLTELPCVQTIANDPCVYLSNAVDAIDLLIINGDDALTSHDVDRCLSYLRIAEKRLHAASLIMLDDTPYFQGRFTGRGALGAPWLLERGWQILRSGYQTIFARQTND